MSDPPFRPEASASPAASPSSSQGPDWSLSGERGSMFAKPTVYDASVTDDYGALLSAKSPFSWLSLILEDQAFSLLPSDRDIALLDLACGVGGFCGRAAQHGIREVAGVDVSPSQIRAARRNVGDSVRFEVADACQAHALPGFRGGFDVVNASWLYDAADDTASAIAMARGARACLRPGGRHQGLEVNSGIRASGPSELEAFGIAIMPDHPHGTRPRDGDRICADLLVDPANGRILRTYVTYFDEESLRGILTEAGFRDIIFHAPETWRLSTDVNPETRSKFADYVATNPEMISFTAVA